MHPILISPPSLPISIPKPHFSHSPPSFPCPARQVRANLTAVDLRRMDEYGTAWSPRNDTALASVVASSAPLDLALFDHACRSLKSALRRLSPAETAQLEAYLRSPAAVGFRATATRRFKWLLRAAPLPRAIRTFERQDHGAARADASRRVWSLVPVD